MKITKSLIPKRDDRPKKKKEKTWTSNFETINPEKIFLRNILQKNSSLKKLKEKIEKESNNNMHEIFSSDESRLKAIKYVINASKGKENQKNYMNQNLKNNTKNKKNLSFISYDIPMPNQQKIENKIKVKRSQKIISNKIEQLSPIKKEQNKIKFFKDDKPLNEEDLLRDNNMLSIKNNKKYIFDSPFIPTKQLYEITSQREINLEYIQPNNKYNTNNNLYTQNNFYEEQKIFNEINPIIKNNNFYQKINYNKKIDEREKSPINNNNYITKYPNIIADNNQSNKTFNNFYIHKQINKSAFYDANAIKENIINNYTSNQEKKSFYSNKNNSYEAKYNLKDIYNHRKNISHDAYYNYELQAQNNNKNQIPYYITETNNFYEPKINSNRMNYINNSTKMKIFENSNRKKNIIRIMNNNQTEKQLDISGNNFYPMNLGRKRLLKRKNHSFFINNSIPIKINQYNAKDYTETEYNNNLTQNSDNNFNNGFSFHKKLSTNVNFKTTFSNNDNSTISNDNKEKIINNRILVKKRPLKETKNYETLNVSTKNSLKNKYSLNLNKLSISTNSSFNYLPKKKDNNKIIFNNDDEISEYINKKFEENRKDDKDKKLKYSGYILTKKYKGKILYEVRIEDDIEKLNKKLKEENIKVENGLIEIINVNKREEYDKMKEKIINLENAILKLKEENETIVKKDYLKNELIKKLDKEKQNITNENDKISIELEKIKKLNEDLNIQLKEILNRNNKDNIIKNYKIENTLTINYDNYDTKEKSDNKNFEKNENLDEKNDINKTPKNDNNINNTSINFTISNSDAQLDSKKNNPLSAFGLSKVSEIKAIKSDNVDSADKDIKNNLTLLNEKINNNCEVSSFNENDNE